MKKYRTKSGKVEEKLPGINATVSPSEKVQIAMAGGANTLGDVQTILGQQGKMNNLKGQGAKHLVSFQYADYESEAYGIGPTTDPGTGSQYGGSAGDFEGVTFGETPSFDTGYSSDEGPELSSYPFTPDETTREKATTSALDKFTAANTYSKAKAASLKSKKQGSLLDDLELYGEPKDLPDRLTGEARKSVLDEVAKERAELNKQLDEENKQSLPSKVLQYHKENPELVAGAGLGLDLALGAAFPPALLAAGIGYIANKAMNQPKTTEDTAAMEDITPYGSTVQTAAMEDIGSIPTPPPPSPPDDGGTETPACPRGSTKSASGICLPITSNNTTLAVVDKKDTRATRSQLRTQATRRA